MNQSTIDIIEIMTVVRGLYSENPKEFHLNQFRLDACDQIAQRRGRTRNTIANAYIRELKPHITGTPEFQRYLSAWILNDSNELIDILKLFIRDQEKEEILTDLLNKKTDVQKLLDWELLDVVSEKQYLEGRQKIEIHFIKERKQQLIADAKREGNL